MSNNTCQRDKHLHLTSSNDSVKIGGRPNLESRNESGIEQHPTCSQETQVSVEHDGSSSLNLSFELAYADFEEELKQRAKFRKLLKKETGRMEGCDETTATEK